MSSKYLSKLKWMEDFSTFSDDEQKVLVALSRDDLLWRSKEGLVKSTEIDESILEDALAKLLSRGFVTPSFSSNKNIIYRLTERD